MSINVLESENHAVTATGLLAYSIEQLAGYLKTQDRGGEFNISSLVGVEPLSKSQREELTQKLSQAALLLSLGIDELHTRLENVSSPRDYAPNPAASPLQSESIKSTPPPVAAESLEIASRQELIRAGGRPVCSIQQLSHIIASPMVGYKAVLSWLSDFPDSETGAGEIKTVISRQFMRWWHFRKSQWALRGQSDTEVGFPAFLEASKRKYKGMGLEAMVSAPSFDETIRRQWQKMPASQPPKSQTFSAYHHALKIRLSPYDFTPTLQLRKDPQKQTAWTDWLEYLSFELRCLETFTLTAESLEMEYHQSMRRLLEAEQPNGINAMSNPAASDNTQARQRRHSGKDICMAKELAVARANRNASQKLFDDFVRETEPYRQARKAAFYQRHRVAWVIEEARVVEAEMSLQSSSAKSKKRKLRGEDTSESPPKRIKRGDGGRSATSVAPTGKPHLRRSTRQCSTLVKV